MTSAHQHSGSLRELAARFRADTLRIHAQAPETRVASSLSAVEIYTCLFYGGLLRHNPANPRDPARDRLIVSKGHGSISLYPILADRGFFSPEELARVCRPGTFLGGIPDPIIPGYETVNGSLGHGPGVGTGMAIALQRQGSDRRVMVVVGDGELHEGAVWEALLFAAQQKLNNLILIVDDNGRCMMDYTSHVVDLAPLPDKLRAFGWSVEEVNGHDVDALCATLRRSMESSFPGPRAVITHTIKGKGAPALEDDPLCHVRTLTPGEVEELTGGAP
ncbi:MAG TPA: transketolase [Kiritimatiellia bacterium]|jgi:transketolase|nr:transketolase [Kiritimatiellia bacterium]HQF19805.1 transketolase [Kiritimatiellia bacterium]HQG74021.1 transketolase [Kiritimatiellia bacterium]